DFGFLLFPFLKDKWKVSRPNQENSETVKRDTVCLDLMQPQSAHNDQEPPPTPPNDGSAPPPPAAAGRKRARRRTYKSLAFLSTDSSTSSRKSRSSKTPPERPRSPTLDSGTASTAGSASTAVDVHTHRETSFLLGRESDVYESDGSESSSAKLSSRRGARRNTAELGGALGIGVGGGVDHYDTKISSSSSAPHTTYSANAVASNSDDPATISEKAQRNREAQRAFRKRRELYIQNLEVKATRVDELEKQTEHLENQVRELRSQLSALSAEKDILVREREVYLEERKNDKLQLDALREDNANLLNENKRVRDIMMDLWDQVVDKVQVPKGMKPPSASGDTGQQQQILLQRQQQSQQHQSRQQQHPRSERQQEPALRISSSVSVEEFVGDLHDRTEPPSLSPKLASPPPPSSPIKDLDVTINIGGSQRPHASQSSASPTDVASTAAAATTAATAATPSSRKSPYCYCVEQGDRSHSTTATASLRDRTCDRTCTSSLSPASPGTTTISTETIDRGISGSPYSALPTCRPKCTGFSADSLLSAPTTPAAAPTPGATPTTTSTFTFTSISTRKSIPTTASSLLLRHPYSTGHATCTDSTHIHVIYGVIRTTSTSSSFIIFYFYFV
ncbi:hypothetical protein HK102_004825, partial [Quaeritorhiza haematococci]